MVSSGVSVPSVQLKSVRLVFVQNNSLSSAGIIFEGVNEMVRGK